MGNRLHICGNNILCWHRLLNDEKTFIVLGGIQYMPSGRQICRFGKLILRGNGDDYMSREEVFEKLNEVFRDVFDDESITVTDATTADDIEEWDSLEHINLLAAVEQEFGMKFNMGQVVSMKNVGEMADIILAQI